MNINDMFPSKYISAADVTQPFTLRISGVQPEEMTARDGTKEMKGVLYFSNAKKGLVLNKINATVIADCYGSETESWSGQMITLYKDRVQAFGEMVDAVRVRLPEANAVPPVELHQRRYDPPQEHNPLAQPSPSQPRPAAVQTADHDEDPEIPF